MALDIIRQNSNTTTADYQYHLIFYDARGKEESGNGCWLGLYPEEGHIGSGPNAGHP